MTPQAALEALDQKARRVHTLQDTRRVCEKSQTSPAALTDDDLTIIRYFHGEAAADKYATLRAKALAGPPVPPAPRTKPAPSARVTVKRFESYTETFLFPLLKDLFGKQKDRIASLEAEIEKLKSRPLMKWAGVHIAGVPYAEASLVTRSGSLWAATTVTTTTPGEAGSDWRLVVKRGAYS